jgi:hypothetical protein
MKVRSLKMVYNDGNILEPWERLYDRSRNDLLSIAKNCFIMGFMGNMRSKVIKVDQVRYGWTQLGETSSMIPHIWG